MRYLRRCAKPLRTLRILATETPKYRKYMVLSSESNLSVFLCLCGKHGSTKKRACFQNPLTINKTSARLVFFEFLKNGPFRNIGAFQNHFMIRIFKCCIVAGAFVVCYFANISDPVIFISLFQLCRKN